MKTNEKKKRFNIFDMNRDGKGVKREPEGPPDLKKFFKLLYRKFMKLISINLMMMPQIPCYLLLIIYLSSKLFNYGTVFSTIYTTFLSLFGAALPVATNAAFPPLYGFLISTGSVAEGVFSAGSPAVAQMLNVFGNIVELPAYSVGYYVFLGILALFTLVTWGWQNVGAAYLSRDLVRGYPVFIWSDYFHAIKKNFGQGLLVGLIDLLILSVLTVDILYFMNAGSGFFASLIFFVMILILVLYLVMRRYMYLMLVTFDIKTWKLLKNALIFTVLGLKRNVMAILGKAVILVINYLLFIALIRINIILPLILPLFYYFAVSSFISAYAAYPVIDKYMIAPYAKETKEETEETEEAHGENPGEPT